MFCFYRCDIRVIGLFLAILTAGCSESDIRNSGPNSLAEPSDTLNADYAEGFRFINYQDYTILEVLNPFQNRVDTLRYALIERGEEFSDSPPADQVIEVPVRSMLAASTTHVGLLEIFNSTNIISGMVDGKYVYNEELRKRVENGEVVNFSGGELNREEAVSLAPELMMISGGMASELDEYDVLEESGITILANTEWLETTPLGKAEWIKVMGALLDRQQEAKEKFDEIEQKYEQYKQKVEEVDNKPLVINNLPYQGSWYVSGGRSVTAQYFRDAGADYPWFDNDSTGGLQHGFETVYEEGLEADIWLHPGDAMSIEDILEADSRFRDFKSVQEEQVFNHNARMSEGGGDDFWESGVVRPDRVLADLIHILHPDRLPNHELYYYQKLK